MKYGYIDESGAPGVASYDGDCFLVSLVVFGTQRDCEESIHMIEKLCQKLCLPADYEFHCSSNSTRSQTEFLKVLDKLKFRFITIAVHKNDFRRTASYSRISNLLIDEIEKWFPNIKIEMDSNPTLYAELRKCIRKRKLNGVKIRERNSRSSRLIQVADYVVNICAKKVKVAPKSREWYAVISKKVLALIEIND